jgi:hypothetical protein
MTRCVQRHTRCRRPTFAADLASAPAGPELLYKRWVQFKWICGIRVGFSSNEPIEIQKSLANLIIILVAL